MKFLLMLMLPCLAWAQVPGGVHDVDVKPTDEFVQFAAHAAAMQLVQDGLVDADANTALVEIVKSQEQVVAGWKYMLTLRLAGGYLCDVTVWYRDWLQGAERLQVLAGPTCQAAPAKRSGEVSGKKPLDSSNGMLMDVLGFAACAYNDMSNNFLNVVLGETSGITFTTQVTSGMTYRFYNVPLTETSCSKSEVTGCSHQDYSSCKATANGQTYTCALTVQSQPWMNPPLTLTNIQC